MLSDKPTYSHQSMLAAYCRDGDDTNLHGVNPKRAKHYRRLVFNVVLDSLSSAYPLTKQLLQNDEWQALIETFFSKHPCQNPQVWKMPYELYEFVERSDLLIKDKYPYLSELLYFEWLEIEYFMLDDKPLRYTILGNIETSELILNPESGIYHFQYPVHLKKAVEIEFSDKGNFYLAIHRHPESNKVHFTNLSPALVLILEQLQEKPKNLADLTLDVADQLHIELNQEILNQITHFIRKAMDNKLILGFVL